MKLNIGGIESFIRIFAGLCLAYAALYGYVGTWGYFGLYFVASGMARFCIVYKVLGVSTNSIESI